MNNAPGISSWGYPSDAFQLVKSLFPYLELLPILALNPPWLTPRPVQVAPVCRLRYFSPTSSHLPGRGLRRDRARPAP